LRGLAHAAIDVSDGLAGDLRHIAERSGLGAVVHYADIPRPAALAKLNDEKLERDCVLSGGDDYELLFTAARERRAELEALSRELDIALSRIGTVHKGAAEVIVLDVHQKPMAYRGGFDHFGAR
jgi:thiamine-monophosphate kinase